MQVERDGLIGTEWQCVSGNQFKVLDPDNPDDYDIFVSEKLVWCLNFEGKGRFHVDNIFGQIYFECDEDREMFLLRWSR